MEKQARIGALDPLKGVGGLYKEMGIRRGRPSI